MATPPQVTQPTPITRPAIRTPRAAAIAGIAFAVLLTTALILVRIAVPHDPGDAGTWLTNDGKRSAVILAMNLLPFAGIAFLWFIGVVRDRIGQGEDRFFATVFLGSGLLFIAMLFATGAVAGGLLLSSEQRPPPGVWTFGRHVTYTLLTVYAMRMAAVFTISTTTIATRLGLAPRWLSASGSRRASSCSSPPVASRGSRSSSRCGSSSSACTSWSPRSGPARSPRTGCDDGLMVAHVSIGEFSMMTYLSIMALRHDHDVGLLEPAETDPSSG